MSSALAIASVTAVLRELLRDALVDHGVSTLVPGADVSAMAPDQVTLGSTGTTGLNLYLYGTSPNAALRNTGLPSRGADGLRLSNPPLALDLHYLLTAYGSDELHADILLGYGMHRLHEVPILERSTVQAVLANTSILSGRLADSGLGDQVELIKVTPEPMGAEQISKLWAAFQATYRPTAAYRASVVLVQAEAPTRSAPPVLTRGPRDPGTGDERGVLVVSGLVPPVPTLSQLVPPASQPAVRLGDAFRLQGHHLDGSAHAVEFSHARFPVAHSVAPDATAAEALDVTVPAGAPADWPAGVYTVRATLTRDGESRTTNTLPLTLAPTMDVPGIGVALASGTATLTVPVTPHVREGQSASLVVGDREMVAEAFSGTVPTLTFVLADAVPGTYLVRLRVDGAESVFIDRTVSPPEFEAGQQVVIP